MLSELQDQIREKELNLLQAKKTIKLLETEKIELQTQLKEKDSKISKLTEELLVSKEKLKKPETKNPNDYWKRELAKKNNGLHKLQDLFRNLHFEKNIQIDKDIKNLKAIFAEEKQSVDLKLKMYSELEIQNQIKISKLEQDNLNLKSQIESYNYNELTSRISSLTSENFDIKRQLEILRKSNNLHDLALLTPDIHQISIQVHQLLLVIQSLKAGKEISLRVLFCDDEKQNISSAKQLLVDVASLKKDLGQIKDIVSDYHAEHLGFNICLTQ
ncbi:hypothetical protein SteCoe_8429 [Stentor coeruleus]|uniref:Uncharacterized protein n=1 Tax=Stentor coeruleus TaxID=5963 RepID=A0A1R2CKG2_9CILI|nr:hypothetical protein SteCoe_8429 [Stentor coeruleus]